MDAGSQTLLIGVAGVLWGCFATIAPYRAAWLGRLGYSLTWPREGFEPEYPEIWLARVLGVASLGFGTFMLYTTLA